MGAIIKSFLQDVIDGIGTQWINVIIAPFLPIIDYLGKFKFDLKGLQVTCAGAAAPVELVCNMMFLGTVIILTYGNFQPYKLLTYDSMVAQSNKMFCSKIYMQWFLRERGKHVYFSFKGIFFYAARLTLALGWFVFSSVDLFQSLLIFLMSSVYFGNFIATGNSDLGTSVVMPGMHEFSDSCNSVEGFIGVDEFLALAASILFWFFAAPMIYEIANLLVPGIPPGCDMFHAIDKEKEDFKSWFGVTKYLKLFSFGAPDLWWAVLADLYMKQLSRDIPSGAGFYVKSLRELAKLHKDAAKDERDMIIPTDGVISAGTAVADGLNGNVLSRQSRISITNAAIQSQLIAAIEKPVAPTFTIEVSRQNGYIAAFSCNKLIRDKKIFENVFIDHTISGYKYILIKINRATGVIALIQTYDIYSNGLYADGRGAYHLAIELNRTTEDFVIVLATIDSSMNHVGEGLPEAVYRCGGSKEMFGRRPLLRGYILVGVPGCGESRGLEVKPTEIAPELFIDFSVLHSEGGIHVNEKVSTGRHYISSSNADRTKQENMEWKVFNVEQLPQYWSLCKQEYAAIVNVCASDICMPSPVQALIMILVIVGVGHVATKIGRRAIYIVIWKYARFFQSALGIWTDDLVEMYRIHDVVHQYTSVFDDAFVQREIQDHKDMIPDAVKKTKAHITSSSPNITHRLEFYESQKVLLKDTERQKQLKKDYGSVLYALIAPRATFFQLLPYISVISIFASFTAESPIFVYSASLQCNLTSGIEKHSLEKGTQIVQQEFDRAWDLKLEESKLNSYEIPRALKESDIKDTSGLTLFDYNLQVDMKNKLSRDRQSDALKHPKILVRMWQSYFLAFVLFIGCSRYIQYGKGVYKCMLSVLLLSASKELSEVMSTVTIVFLVPFALAKGLELVIFVGSSLWITDEELYRELGWIVRSSRWLYTRFWSLCCKTDFNASERSEDGLSPTALHASIGCNELELRTIPREEAIDAPVNNGSDTNDLEGQTATSSFGTSFFQDYAQEDFSSPTLNPMLKLSRGLSRGLG